MLIVISPAKTLDYESEIPELETTQPEFLKESAALIKELRKLSPQQISSLMKISDKLGILNYDRFQSWKRPFTATNARAALLAFKGDVYTGLDAESMGKRDFSYAQKHLRMLSGLYGILRPLDLMQPYRLEMGTKFENSRGKNLYEFWGEKTTGALNEQLHSLKSRELVNLASNEYFKSIRPRALDAEVITPHFKDLKNGQYKMISFFAKKARGMMSRWAIDQRVKKAEELKGFDVGGYEYSPEMSSEHDWVFTRDEAQ
ncbi:peroxide stress resistance protein YaaA [Microbulbifer sp. NBRC 101763]|uniref:peroxide stress protein YaaA n=1 Tax=unclassified Microbulbifer TaxID=2619833 RepID=UPI0024ADDDF3|nr:peroxide stress protein YaaA [Microbulbifer sp. MLAF003]WHI51311.1 peroxide stress protein YaaA [Microbulbifer sp. MLAF003]